MTLRAQLPLDVRFRGLEECLVLAYERTSKVLLIEEVFQLRLGDNLSLGDASAFRFRTAGLARRGTSDCRSAGYISWWVHSSPVSRLEPLEYLILILLH